MSDLLADSLFIDKVSDGNHGVTGEDWPNVPFEEVLPIGRPDNLLLCSQFLS